MTDFLDLPTRTTKPRAAGITLVLDKGLGMNEVISFLDTCSSYVDFVKLGWGTGYLTLNVVEKIKLYIQRGIPVYFGGTMLEVCIAQGKFKQYLGWIKDLGIKHVEVSNGIIEMSPEQKVAYIKELKKDFTVFSEVGSKDADIVIPPYKWVELIKRELDAGAYKVIAEARESGTVGIYRATGEVRMGLIDEVVREISDDNLIFEAPQKAQQVWFIKKFGSNVNLGNISTQETIPLETLRMGLRGDTLKQFHIKNEKD